MTSQGGFSELHQSLSQFDAQWEDLLNNSTKVVSSPRKPATTNVVSLSSANVNSQGPVSVTSNDMHLVEVTNSELEEEEESDEDSHDEAKEKAKETMSSLGNKLSILITQLEDLRGKYKHSLEINSKVELVNKELLSQIDTLEEENNELQETLKEKLDDAKRSKLIGNGIGASLSNNENKRQKNKNNSNSTKGRENQGGFNLALISEGDLDDELVGINSGASTKSVIEKFSQKFFDYVPFKKDIQEVRSTFGGATASYFTFFRWMLFNFIVMGIWGGLFSAVHILKMLVRGDTNKIVSGDQILPGFMDISTFQSDESVIYTSNVLIGVGILLVFCSHKIIMEDRQMKHADVIEKQNDFTFSKDILCKWDNSQSNDKEVTTHLFGLISLSLKEKLAESLKKGIIVSRSRGEVLVLYSKRLLVFLIYCCIQVVSYAAIIYLTIENESVQASVSNIPVMRFFTAYIVPGAVTLINAMTPSLYKHLTKFEHWDSGQVALNVLIARMYLSNIMNLLILALSYGLLADPFLLADSSNSDRRKQLENTFESATYTCRLNAAAEGLFSLVLSEFFVNGTIFFLVGYGPNFINRYIKRYKKWEMNIAQRIVALFYFINLMMLAFPFCPLGVVFMPLMLGLRLKWEKSLTLKYYAKPKEVWLAHKAGSFFVQIYMLSLTIVALPAMLLFLSQQTFAKECSIQDNFVQLCTDDVDSTTNTCTLDTESEYYDYFSNSAHCEEGYPACVCDYSCGPFIGKANSFQSIRSIIYSFGVSKGIWKRLIAPSYLAWWVVGFLYVLIRMKKNSLFVTEVTYAERERGYETQIMSLENEKKQHTKLINRLKLLEK